MVGAITTLIIVVAVFLAYNANNGLPFVPVYRVSVEIPNAARLTNNNEVRIGGNRVGVVESIDPIRADDATGSGCRQSGATAPSATTPARRAQLNLKLDKTAEPLPEDSTFRVRYRSSFGLKYLEIVRGDERARARGLHLQRPRRQRQLPAAGRPGDLRLDRARRAPGTAASSSRPSSTTINNTFDTQDAEQRARTSSGFGDAFAGRGASLNEAIDASTRCSRT